MTGALIAVSNQLVGQEGQIQTVNARELHAFLQVATAFKDWFPRRVAEFSFVQDVDFVSSFLSVDEGGTGKREFHITIDMAKELSMVERNDRGRQARRYFIECERRAKAAIAAPPPQQFLIPKTMGEALRLAADLDDQCRALEHRILLDAPKVDGFERIAEAGGSMCLRDSAKTLQIQPSALVQRLSGERWIYRHFSRRNWIGYQDKLDSGLLVHKVKTFWNRHTGADDISEQVRVTAKGLTKLTELLRH